MSLARASVISSFADFSLKGLFSVLFEISFVCLCGFLRPVLFDICQESSELPLTREIFAIIFTLNDQKTRTNLLF